MKKIKSIILILICILVALVIWDKGNNIDNNITLNESEIETDIITYDKTDMEKEELNRITYKDDFYYEEIGTEIKNRITGFSYPTDFDSNYNSISYDDLRYVKVKHFNFDDKIKDGELIVHKEVAQDIVEIFYEFYINKYPIHKLTLVDEYRADDELSMRDNNTSCFNYRIVSGSKTLSWHAFGLAIDINPLYNPYIKGNTISPSNSSKYTDRSLNLEGMIDKDDMAYKLFTQYGWKWGGDYKNTKDYQHFYKEGILDNNTRKIKK